MKKSLNLKLWIRIAVSIVICVFLFLQLKHSGSLGLIADRLQSLSYSPLLLAAGIFLLSLFTSTLQWYMLLRIQDIRIPFYMTWQFYMIGQFFSNFLPTNWGGDFVRIYDTGTYSDNWEKSTASIIVDRVLGLFALFAVGLAHAFLFYSKYFSYKYLFTASGLLLVPLLFFIFFDFKKLEGLIKSQNRIMKKISRFLDKFLLALASYQHDRRLLPVLGISVVTQYLRILMNVFIAFSLGYGLSQIPFVNYFVVIPVVGLLSALPIAINGIGVREITGSFLVNNMVEGNNSSVTIIFTLGFLVMTVISLLGALYFIQHQNRKRKEKKAGSS